jgi:hypothetical protein
MGWLFTFLVFKARDEYCEVNFMLNRTAIPLKMSSVLLVVPYKELRM